jgi:tripartite-type tricarboxylate transporter receptor subunit TctC
MTAPVQLDVAHLVAGGEMQIVGMRNIVRALLLMCLSSVVLAVYPERPIRLIVPYAPGGSSDAIARVLAQMMVAQLGQSVVIDNRAGASSIIGRSLTARAVPDGYTLMLGDAVHSINVHVLRNIPYDPIRDFSFISMVGRTPMVLAVQPQTARDLAAFISLVRAQPGRLNYGNGGSGSITHLTGELFKKSLQLDVVGVPYKSIGLAVTGLIGAQVQAAFPSLPTTVGHVAAGRLRVLAVAAEQRASVLPEVPTFVELGVKEVIVANWFGVMGPPALPAPLLTRLVQYTHQALAQPELRERFNAMALEIAPNQPPVFKAMVAAEIDRWGKVVKLAGIQPE